MNPGDGCPACPRAEIAKPAVKVINRCCNELLKIYGVH